MGRTGVTTGNLFLSVLPFLITSLFIGNRIPMVTMGRPSSFIMLCMNCILFSVPQWSLVNMILHRGRLISLA